VRAAIGVVAVLAACDADSLKIAFQLSSGPVQACPSAVAPAAPTCADVPVLCDAVLDLRIGRPSDPPEAYVALCEPIPRGARQDLCSLEQVDLPVRQLPKDTLEVQAMIWPRDAVRADPVTGALDCKEIYGQPVSIGFGVNGFPEEVTPSPSLGGRAYYHAGDGQTVITLGCSDLAAVNRPVCTGQIELRASVSSFEDPLAPVTSPAGLLVSVGEPRYVANRDEYEWRSIQALNPLSAPPPPTWFAAIDAIEIEDSICVEVIADSGTNTPSVRCVRTDASARQLELAGTWLPRSRLQQILAGLGLSEVPPQGLTVGILLDEQGRPAAGYQIKTSPVAEVQYLTAGDQVVPGGVVTTQSGAFVSQQAPYGADFRAFPQNMLQPRAQAVGGRVNGTVTLVVLRLGLI